MLTHLKKHDNLENALLWQDMPKTFCSGMSGNKYIITQGVTTSMEKNRIRPIPTGKSMRMSYQRQKEVLEMPNLIEVQKDSYDWFLRSGLKEVFDDISPISDYGGRLSLEFVDFTLCEDDVKYSIEECKQRDATYAAPLKVKTAEAQSIAIALEHIVPPRPLTHDLFATFAQAFNVILKEVYIYKFEDGVFYSELEFSDGERSIKLDSRTSDAIAIALRVNCDIFTSEEIVKECGVVLEDTLSIPADEPEEDDNLLELEPDEIKDEAQLKKWLSLLDIQEINERLEDAIADENYEYAKMYKDELRRREEEEDTNK